MGFTFFVENDLEQPGNDNNDTKMFRITYCYLNIEWSSFSDDKEGDSSFPSETYYFLFSEGCHLFVLLYKNLLFSFPNSILEKDWLKIVLYLRFETQGQHNIK